jgi:4-amino-4-deoxy-L-arabinose transferase-like glycosyltransferase
VKSSTTLRLAVAFAIAVPLVWMYSSRLGEAPVHLHHDEVLVAVNAHAIVATGRDPGGTAWPLYFHIVNNLWQTPISIYATALGFTVLPVSEASIRAPSVVVGLLTVAVMYLVARAMFRSDFLAAVAAVLLALTPAHFIHSRLGFDHHYPELFVAVWLLFLLAFIEHGHLRTLFAAALALGVGAYSYLASLIMMPVYFLATCAMLAGQRLRSARAWAIAAIGFFAPLVLLVFWLIGHPGQFAQNVQMYNLYDASRLNPLQGAHELLSYTSLTERVSVYYRYFDPSFLLFSGDTSTVHSTRRAGVFLFAFGALLAVGLWRIAVHHRSPFELLLLAGFLLSPLGGTVAAEHYRISRALVMLPFATLIATVGFEFLVRHRRAGARALAIVLLVAIPVQFAQFYRDYMGDYRVRSAQWFEGDLAGALEEVIAREPAGAVRPVYLGSDISWVDWYWKVYTLKHGREDLDGRVFDATHPEQIAPGGFLVARFSDKEHASLVARGGLRLVQLFDGPTDIVKFAVLEKPQ